MSAAVSFRYRAFLSYSHKDIAWGRWLQKALERYRVDRDLTGRLTPIGKNNQNLRPIFVDRDDFAGGSSLKDATLRAIEASEFLIVVCSPHAAASVYVNEEIRLFKATGGAGRIIPIIVDGEPGDPRSECFPPALRFAVERDGQIGTTPAEPIAADARDHADGREIAKQKVVAGLLGVGLDEIRKRAARAERRRLAVLSSTAVAMAVLAVLAAGAAWVARSRTIEAEQRLDWALAAAGGITSKVATFKNKFGVPAPVLADLLQEVQQLLNRLSQQGVKSSELVLREAVLLGELSDGNLNIGNTAAALENAIQASARFERLAAEKPGSAPKSDLSWSYIKTGYILSRQNRNAEAKSKFMAAHDIFASLVASEPDAQGWKVGLAASLSSLASSFATEGNTQQEKIAIDQELSIRRQLRASAPNDLFTASTLAGALNYSGAIAVNSDDIVEAETLLREALEINGQLVKVDPTSSRWAENLAFSQQKLGYALERQGRTNEAVIQYLSARETLHRLVQADPTNISKRIKYADSVQSLASTYSMAGRMSEAAIMFDEVVDARKKILSMDPMDASQKLNLTISMAQVAKSKWDLGDTTSALSNSEEAARLAAELVRADPNNNAAKANRIISLAMIAIIREAKGDEAGSISALEEGVALSAEVAAQDPANKMKAKEAFITRVMLAMKYRGQNRTNDSIKILQELTPLVEQQKDTKDPLWMNLSSNLYEQKYMTYWDMNDIGAAVEAAEKCLEITKKWAQLDSDSSLAKQRLGSAYTIVGIAARRSGNLDAARKALFSGLEVRKSLLASAPLDMATKGDLAISWSRLYSLSADQGDFAGALEAEQQALKMREELVEKDPSNLFLQDVLAQSYSNIGIALERLDRRTEARDAFAAALKVRHSLAKIQPGRNGLEQDIQWTSRRLSELRADEDRAEATSP
jgi:tetratricopeptide (TPR) repeat protein